MNNKHTTINEVYRQMDYKSLYRVKSQIHSVMVLNKIHFGVEMQVSDIVSDEPLFMIFRNVNTQMRRMLDSTTFFVDG